MMSILIFSAIAGIYAGIRYIAQVLEQIPKRNEEFDPFCTRMD